MKDTDPAATTGYRGVKTTTNNRETLEGFLDRRADAMDRVLVQPN